MASATDLAPAIDATAVRHVLAEATERLRALELAAEARAMREIALTGLRALATALFTDAHAEAGKAGVLAALVADEVGRITELLGASEIRGQTAAVVVGRWTR